MLRDMTVAEQKDLKSRKPDKDFYNPRPLTHSLSLPFFLSLSISLPLFLSLSVWKLEE